MPLNRTPPISPLSSSFATPLQHYPSDSNVAALRKEEDIICTASLAKTTLRKVKRKREGAGFPSQTDDEEDDNISKFDLISMLTDLQNKQDSKLDAILNTVTDLKDSFESMSTKYGDALKRIECLEVESKNDKDKIAQLEIKIEVLERNSKSTSVEIRNVPQGQKETKKDLHNIVCKTAQALDIQLQDWEIKNIYRTNTKSPTNPIIADFTTVLARDKFLSCYKNYIKEHRNDKLSTSNLDIEGPKKQIYISENLTQGERKLYYLAREFSKTHGYSFCWTSFGRIFIRKAEGFPQIRIASKTDLDELCNNPV